MTMTVKKHCIRLGASPAGKLLSGFTRVCINRMMHENYAVFIRILDFFKNRKKYAGEHKLPVVNWFNVAGIVVGAIVANTLQWGIAAINAMAIAAVCYFIGEIFSKNNKEA